MFNKEDFYEFKCKSRFKI
ncbi:Protein CBG25263 [Caenorhabditis briggsae]|uniref:Protein CBG25263 n=1 Tax=Caenorhabditis briggsae TaxID=6238 RepID=B6IFN3_CAEBR|nr:Protein CBG25263 [Caenorhabditis briggsae]CAR98713.1 Protein CBG25263 [Caenorhabditis briggsae]